MNEPRADNAPAAPDSYPAARNRLAADSRSRLAAPPRSRLAAAPAAIALFAAAALLAGMLTGVGRPDAAELEGRARAALIAGDRATAAVHFKRLLQLDPANAEYRNGLALAQGKG